jgi:mannosyl-oligosaccharide alpha-1,2-mannosidase
LWISGLRSEFKQARDWVASNAAAVFSRPVQVSFFESTIRVLGGLLAAFHLSGDHMFVDRAADIGKRLAAAFETKSGIPHCSVNLANRVSSNPGWTNGASVLSEVGSVQLEFFYLTKVTGDDQFRQKVHRTKISAKFCF